MKTTASAKTASNATATSSRGDGIQSILVPLDFSDASRKALVYAAWFAQRFGAKLTLLNVLVPFGTPDFYQPSMELQAREALMERCRTELEKIVAQEGISMELVERIDIRFGHSYNEIVEAARELNSDMIIISTHGYTGWKHTIFGSTTERVVRQARCPVLVVRDDEREFVHAQAKSTEGS